MEFYNVKLNNDFKIHIVQYKNLYSNSYNDSDFYNWSDWLNKLQIPMVNKDKYKHGLCVYGDFESIEKDNKNINKYRSDATLINRSAITLDYDEIKDFQGLYEMLKSKLNYVAWAFHTTHSYTIEKPRIRLIVPLNEPVSAENYRKYSRTLAHHIGYEVDEASFVPSQAMALPVKRDNNAVYIFKYNDAPAITTKELEGLTTNLDELQEGKPITINYSKQYKKRDSSYWYDIAFGVVEGGRNQALASVIGHLLRRHVDGHLVYGLALAWGGSCNPPLQEKEVAKTFNSILRMHLQDKEVKDG